MVSSPFFFKPMYEKFSKLSFVMVSVACFTTLTAFNTQLIVVHYPLNDVVFIISIAFVAKIHVCSIALCIEINKVRYCRMGGTEEFDDFFDFGRFILYNIKSYCGCGWVRMVSTVISYMISCQLHWFKHHYFIYNHSTIYRWVWWQCVLNSMIRIGDIDYTVCGCGWVG